MRERKQKLKDAEAERTLRVDRLGEIEKYQMQQESPLKKFDENLCRWPIGKVKVQSMVEALFVFKTEVEGSEVIF